MAWYDDINPYSNNQNAKGENPLINGFNAISNARDSVNNYLSNNINLPGNNANIISNGVANGYQLRTGINGGQTLYNPAQDQTVLKQIPGVTPLDVQNRQKVMSSTLNGLKANGGIIPPSPNQGNIALPANGNFNPSSNASNNPNQIANTNPNPNQLPSNANNSNAITATRSPYAGSNGILAGPTIFNSATFSNGNTNQNQVMNNNPFAGFQPQVDQYNINRRDQMDQAFNQQNQDFTNSVNNLVDSGSLRDAVRFSIMANQNRRLMQRSDAQNKYANNLASQNLNQNNQLSQKDTADLRNNALEQQRIDNQNNQFQQNYGLDAQRLENSTLNDNRNYNLASRRENMLENEQLYNQNRSTFQTNQQVAQNQFDNQLKLGQYNIAQMEAMPKIVQGQFNQFASGVFGSTSEYGKQLDDQFASEGQKQYPGISSQQLQDYIMQRKQAVIQASMSNPATPWGQANLMAQAQSPKNDKTEYDIIYEDGKPKITGGKISGSDAMRMGLIPPSIVGQGQSPMQSGIANYNPNVKGNQF